MHSFARHRHSRAGKASATETKGLVMGGGWRHDLMAWFIDTFLFRGQWRKLRQRTADLARIQPGEQVLDVGCGTGTLAMEVARRIGRAGRVAGVDPGTEQVARARAKAARRHLPVEFQIGVIEQLAFPDRSFDVVLSTLMMHHVPAPLKRQGSRKSPGCSNQGDAWSWPISHTRRNELARLRAFTPGGAAYRIWLPWSRTPVSTSWKWRRCGPHASLLSRESALSRHTKARDACMSKERKGAFYEKRLLTAHA